MATQKMKMLGVALAAGAVIEAARRRRSGRDPVHAPGHRHKGPPPDVPGPAAWNREHGGRAQPWVRTSHSDSQQRRFRR